MKVDHVPERTYIILNNGKASIDISVGYECECINERSEKETRPHDAGVSASQTSR